jgi:hypothetical protein
MDMPAEMRSGGCATAVRGNRSGSRDADHGVAHTSGRQKERPNMPFGIDAGGIVNLDTAGIRSYGRGSCAGLLNPRHDSGGL